MSEGPEMLSNSYTEELKGVTFCVCTRICACALCFAGGTYSTDVHTVPLLSHTPSPPGRCGHPWDKAR